MLTTLGLPRPGRPARQPVARSLSACSWSSRVVLTYSRTSLLAVALIVALGGHRPAARGLLGVGAAGRDDLGRHQRPVSLQTLGPFSDRSGSDALRTRIVKLEELQIADAPWYGHGPGTSWVDVQGQIGSSSTTATSRSTTRAAGSAQVLIVLAASAGAGGSPAAAPRAAQPLVRSRDHRRGRVRGQPRRGACWSCRRPWRSGWPPTTPDRREPPPRRRAGIAAFGPLETVQLR